MSEESQYAEIIIENLRRIGRPDLIQRLRTALHNHDLEELKRITRETAEGARISREAVDMIRQQQNRDMERQIKDMKREIEDLKRDRRR